MKQIREQIYENKFSTLHEMGKFLERHQLPKHNQEEIDNMHRTIAIKETEFIDKNLPTQKILCLNGFTGEFYQIVKDETQIL